MFLQDMIQASKILHNHKLLPTCLTCEHFDHKLEVCKLVKRRPPAEVIVYGCEMWKDDRMPF